MTLTIEWSADMEAALNALARARGAPLPDVIRALLESQLPAAAALAARERAAAWRASTQGLPARPPLADEAMARASFYGARA
jgi:hypothetical protein